MKFRKRPVVIEAMRFEHPDGPAIEKWSGGRCVLSPVLEPTPTNPTGEYLQIHTLEGIMTATYGDWIVRGIAGEYYPVRESIFLDTYDPVPDAPEALDGMAFPGDGRDGYTGPVEE